VEIGYGNNAEVVGFDLTIFHIAVLADLGAGDDVGEVPDFCAFAVIRSINLIMGS